MHLPVGERFHLFSDLGVRLGTVGIFVEMGRLHGQHFDNAEQGLVTPSVTITGWPNGVGLEALSAIPIFGATQCRDLTTNISIC